MYSVGGSLKNLRVASSVAVSEHWMKPPRAFWGPGTFGVQLCVTRSRSSVGTTKKWTSTAGAWVRVHVLRSV